MDKKQKVSVPRGSRIKMSREEKIYQACIAIVVGLVTVVCILPLLYVVGMSLTSEGEMIEKNFFVIIPEHPTLAAYKNLFSSANFFDGMKITILRTFMGIFSALVLTVPVGYILAIKELPFKNPILLYFITTMLIGGGTIPSYLLYRDLHLLNSFWVYIAPSLANTHGILEALCGGHPHGPDGVGGSGWRFGAAEDVASGDSAAAPHNPGPGPVRRGGPLEFLDGRHDLRSHEYEDMADSVHHPQHDAGSQHQHGQWDTNLLVHEDDAGGLQDGRRAGGGAPHPVRVSVPAEVFRKGNVYRFRQGMRPVYRYLGSTSSVPF